MKAVNSNTINTLILCLLQAEIFWSGNSKMLCLPRNPAVVPCRPDMRTFGLHREDNFRFCDKNNSQFRWPISPPSREALAPSNGDHIVDYDAGIPPSLASGGSVKRSTRIQ